MGAWIKNMEPQPTYERTFDADADVDSNGENKPQSGFTPALTHSN